MGSPCPSNPPCVREAPNWVELAVTECGEQELEFELKPHDSDTVGWLFLDLNLEVTFDSHLFWIPQTFSAFKGHMEIGRHDLYPRTTRPIRFRRDLEGGVAPS